MTMSTLVTLLSQPALVLWLLKSTALLVAALAATSLLRRASAGTRHLVWVGTLAGILFLPALSLWTPLRLAILPMSLTTLALPTVSSKASGDANPIVARDQRVAVVGVAAPAVREASARVQSSRALVSPIHHEWHLSIWSTLLVLWAGAATVLLAWLAFGALSVRRIVRSGRPLDGNHAWSAPLCEIADRLDLDAVPRLLASDLVEMPFACGVLEPTVVLPSCAEQWSDSRRRAVLFHELAHVKRRDLVGHTLGRLACAFYWFHPLVWTAARRLRAESERACDDLVLSCGARASDYADHLLDIVISVRRYGAPATAMPMARRRELEGRVLAILDPAVQRIGPGRVQSLGLVGTLGVLALCVAAMTPRREAALAAREAARGTQTGLAAGAPRPSGNAPISRHSTDGLRVLPSTRHGAATKEDPATSTASLSSSSGSTPMPAPSPSPASTSMTVGEAIGTIAQAATNSATSSIAEVLKQVSKRKSGEMDSAKVTLLLKVLRSDRDASVRRMAAWGLSDASDAPDVIDALADALHHDDDANVREMAAWAMSDSHRAIARRALAEALRSDDSDEVRETAAWALGNSEADDQRAALDETLTSDPSPDVRESAAWALGYMPQRPAAHGLVVALRDKSAPVRETAAWALAEIQDDDTAPAITEAFLRETNTEVRTAELRALTFLHANDKEVLDAALSSKDADLRARAVRMLAGADAGAWPEPRPRPRPRPMP
jgi:beta-lactamase regulating signal transducer with metallopeptidase domain/HEAT repeat protein